MTTLDLEMIDQGRTETGGARLRFRDEARADFIVTIEKLNDITLPTPSEPLAFAPAPLPIEEGIDVLSLAIPKMSAELSKRRFQAARKRALAVGVKQILFDSVGVDELLSDSFILPRVAKLLQELEQLEEEGGQ